jgi:hypothetical protein
VTPEGKRWDSAWDEVDTGPQDFVEERLFDVCTMRGGLCVRKREFRDRAEVLEAAGIPAKRAP